MASNKENNKSKLQYSFIVLYIAMHNHCIQEANIQTQKQDQALLFDLLITSQTKKNWYCCRLSDAKFN